LRRREVEVPRRRREEHEADHVGAGMERDVERFRRTQAADLDDEGQIEASQSRAGSRGAMPNSVTASIA
jgi:hypothetical protein